MKVVINGNVATVKSDKIKFEDLKKAKYASLVDDKGKILYRAETGSDAMLTVMNVVFTHADAEGFAAMNIVVNTNIDKESLMENIGPELAELKNYEDDLVKDIAEQLALREAVEATITVQ